MSILKLIGRWLLFHHLITIVFEAINCIREVDLTITVGLVDKTSVVVINVNHVIGGFYIHVNLVSVLINLWLVLVV